MAHALNAPGAAGVAPCRESRKGARLCLWLVTEVYYGRGHTGVALASWRHRVVLGVEHVAMSKDVPAPDSSPGALAEAGAVGQRTVGWRTV